MLCRNKTRASTAKYGFINRLWISVLALLTEQLYANIVLMSMLIMCTFNHTLKPLNGDVYNHHKSKKIFRAIAHSYPPLPTGYLLVMGIILIF